MRILTISDLCWSRPLGNIKNTVVARFGEKDLKRKKYYGVDRYFSLIIDENPDVVFFAGDITGDGSCGHGYQNAMKILLKLLDRRGIQTFMISGNHDEDDYYEELVGFAEDLENSQDISNKLVECRGIKILGISFDKSRLKTELKEILQHNQQKIDIVVAHAELKRRTWLFDLNTDFIITGHFDRKLTAIDNKIFISLDNDSGVISYCMLIHDLVGNSKIEYKIKSHEKLIRFSETSQGLLTYNRNDYFMMNGIKESIVAEEEKLTIWDIIGKKLNREAYIEIVKEQNRTDMSLKYLRGFDYKAGVEIIRAIKNKKRLLSEEEFKHLTSLKVNRLYKISKMMIMDYTGKKIMLGKGT